MERVVSPWNTLSESVDFTSLHLFKQYTESWLSEISDYKCCRLNLCVFLKCIDYLFGFILISILFRAEVRAILCLSVLFNIFAHVLQSVLRSCWQITHTRLTGLPGWAGTRKVKPIWILLKHQLGHMQVCTSLQIDNHASTPPLRFLQAGCPSCRPTNSINALKAKCWQIKLIIIINTDFCCTRRVPLCKDTRLCHQNFVQRRSDIGVPVQRSRLWWSCWCSLGRCSAHTTCMSRRSPRIPPLERRPTDRPQTCPDQLLHSNPVYFDFKFGEIFTHAFTFYRLYVSTTTTSTTTTTHTLHPFNGHFSRTTWVSQYQKGKPVWI